MASSFRAFSGLLEGDLDQRGHLALDGRGEVLQVDGLEGLAAVGRDFDRIGAVGLAAGLGQNVGAGCRSTTTTPGLPLSAGTSAPCRRT